MDGFSLSGFLIFVVKLLVVKIIIGISLFLWRKIKKGILYLSKEKGANDDNDSHSDNKKS